MRKITSVLLLICLIIVFPVMAQGNGRLRITAIDPTNFPDIVLTTITAGSDGLPLSQLDGLEIRENGQWVEHELVGEVDLGVDITFVIDANRGIRIQDDFESTGSPATRLDKVKDSIVRYSDSFMDGNDRVTIVMPLDEGDWGDKSVGSEKFIIRNSQSADEVRNVINNLGRLSTVEVTPLNSMMLAALENAKANPTGKYQAILLYTDSRYLDQQLEFDRIAQEAQEGNIAIFVAILGDSVEQLEIDNARQLFGVTNGRYVPMPFADGVDPLFTIFQTQSKQTQIRYRSKVSQSSENVDVRAQLNGAEASIAYEVEIEAPTVTLGVDSAQPIIRTVDGEEASLPDFLPNSQEVKVNLNWPDGYPRELSSVQLFVNESAQGGDTEPVFNEAGELVLSADISRMRSGIYNLAVRIVDELGLEAESPVFPLAIEIDLEGLTAETVEDVTSEPDPTPIPTEEPETEEPPTAEPTETVSPTDTPEEAETTEEPAAVLPTAVPTAAPESTPAPQPTNFIDNLRYQINNIDELSQPQLIQLLGGALVGLVIFLVLLSLLRRLFSRDKTPKPVATTPAPVAAPVIEETQQVSTISPEQLAADQARVEALGSMIDNPEETQNIIPQFNPGSFGETDGAFLRVIANAPEHSGGIIIQSSNVILGRDPISAQIILKDPSVSRVHARIMQTNGVYRIYDEGSTSGTFLNFKRIGLTPHTLRDNDQVHLGRVHLQFRLLPSGSMAIE